MIASTKPPNAPTAAASVGVARPNTIDPSTASISSARGKNDVSSILKISWRSHVHSAYTTARITAQIASVIQNHWGTGRRSADADGSLGADVAALAATSAFAAGRAAVGASALASSF